jgi:hypothetical protein
VHCRSELAREYLYKDREHARSHENENAEQTI